MKDHQVLRVALATAQVRAVARFDIKTYWIRMLKLLLLILVCLCSVPTYAATGSDSCSHCNELIKYTLDADLGNVRGLLDSASEEQREVMLLQASDFQQDTPLMLAARENHVDVVNLLLNSAPSAATQKKMLDAKNKDGMSALMLASSYGSVDAVRAMLKVAPDIAGSAGLTALMVTIINHDGHDDITDEIDGLLFKWRVDDLDEDGKNAVMWAAMVGNANAVTEMLKLATEKQVELVPMLTQQSKTFEYDALIWASLLGNADVVKVLLAGQDDAVKEHMLMTTDQWGVTALMWASGNGYADVVAVLLDAAPKDTKSAMLRHRGFMGDRYTAQEFAELGKDHNDVVGSDPGKDHNGKRVNYGKVIELLGE